MPEPNDPTPEEIKRACAEIRLEWSMTERRQRKGQCSVRSHDDDYVIPTGVSPGRFDGRHRRGKELEK